MGVWHWLEGLPSELGYGVATSGALAAGAWGYGRLRRGGAGSDLGTVENKWAPRPCSLPLAPARFVDRERELKELDRLLQPAAHGPAVQVAVLSGMRGVGKSAVGSAWAHRHHDAFPGGALTGDFSRR